MALIGASEAARLIGRDRSQIYRALKSGSLSAQKDELGATVFDTSELFRVFRPAGNKSTGNTSNVAANDAANISPQAANTTEQAVLAALLAAEKEKNAILTATVEDLTKLRDRLLGVVESATEQVKLLTDQRQKAAETPAQRAGGGWWPWG